MTNRGPSKPRPQDATLHLRKTVVQESYEDWLAQMLEELSKETFERLKDRMNWDDWNPTETEMLLALAKTFEEVRKAHAWKSRKMAQDASVDLAALVLKCFQIYGRE